MFKCVECDFSGDKFELEVTGIDKGAFKYQAKCPMCGSHKINAAGLESDLRITLKHDGR